MSRPTCFLCALKHVAQARILGSEARLGYQQHYWFALGHLAEAEEELLQEQPQLAETVRLARKQWESNPLVRPDFEALVIEIARVGHCDLDELLRSENKEKLWYDDIRATRERPRVHEGVFRMASEPLHSEDAGAGDDAGDSEQIGSGDRG